jgi:protein-S-isoprenylcysteine O-methyltransferase Ste14
MPLLAGLLLLIFTVLSTWSALTLAIVGKGTPLPFDPPRQLVTTGPYAYLRHPLVAATAGQIVGLGIALGSVPVLAYATTITAIWYFFIRPREERSLEERFGQQVRDYRRAVRGFRPRVTPYRVR